MMPASRGRIDYLNGRNKDPTVYSILFRGLVSFILSFVLTPLARNLFTGWGTIDHPDERQIRPHPIPRIGGIAIALTYAIAFSLAATMILPSGYPMRLSASRSGKD
jgi:UDP-N-acetylmuramyl pentapeptide phosphotransferase/UDP-N-acetylglucosamine-1-phosphate transferase